MAIAFSMCGYAEAIPMLDQYHEVVLDQSLASATVQDTYPKIDMAQTFTAGISGWLEKVQLYAQNLSNTGFWVFDIRSTLDGVPLEDNNAALSQLFIPSNDFTADDTGYINFDLSSSHLNVMEGDVLAFVVRGFDFAKANVNGNIYNPYSGGRAFTRYLEGASDNTWLGGYGAQEDWDFGFKTYVQPIPEPSTMLLLGTGLIGVVVLGRKKFKK